MPSTPVVWTYSACSRHLSLLRPTMAACSHPCWLGPWGHPIQEHFTDHAITQYLSIDNSNDRAERGGWLTALGHPDLGNVRPQHGGWPAVSHYGYVCRANGDALPVPGPSQTPSIVPQVLLGSAIVP